MGSPHFTTGLACALTLVVATTLGACHSEPCPACATVDACPSAPPASPPQEDEPPLALSSPADASAPLDGAAPTLGAEVVRLGVDVLLDREIHRIAGKRVGLITNASGVDGNLVPTVDRFAADGRFELVQIYAPEHGLRGALPAGQRFEDEVDPVTGVPVESLYGKRTAPSAATLSQLDLLVFDIQDVGSRTYTYTSTMGLAMQAAAKAQIPFMVLDRPNPLGGLRVEGPIREQRYQSFVGWGPTPVSHGMTVGELAAFFNAELAIGADLQVIPMEGWRREMVWEDTGLIWVPTSPNIPHSHSAHLYIATGMVAGVSRNIDEGAHYTMPFETIAATFIEPQAFVQALQAQNLPGVLLRPIVYRPAKNRFGGQTAAGVQLIVVDPRAFRPLHTALALFSTIERLYPDQLEVRSPRSFARIWGQSEVRERLRNGESPEDIAASWADDLATFAAARAPHLIYP